MSKLIKLENVHTLSSKEYKKNSLSQPIYYGFYSTPFGEVILAITDNKICYLNFVLKDYATSLKELTKFWNKSEIIFSKDLTQHNAKKVLENQWSGLSILLKGTEFQINVWKSLLLISVGQTSTYKKIAESINSNALRAVGTAIGHNPIAYLVPCHRVINSNGKLGNYGGGKERKKQILQFEGINLR